MGKFRKWLLTLVETRQSATSFGAWVGMSLVVLGILVMAAYVPPVSNWFHLEFWPAVACFLPMMALGLGAGWVESKQKLALPWFGVLILIGATLFQFFWAAMVVLAERPGSFVMASLFLITVTLHGYLHRVTPEFPFGLLGTVVAVAAAVLLRPDSPQVPLLYFVGATGLLLSLLMGGVGLRMHHNVEQSDKLKQALYYQALNEKSREHSEMSRRVLDLLKYNHDAGNTLSAVFLHAQLLEEKIAVDSDRAPELAQFAQSISSLLTQLGRLRTLISSGHRVADEMPVVEVVDVLDVVQEVSRDCASMFPQVAIELSAAQRPASTKVKMHEGAIGLRRVVENVLRNACEGNGTARARRVQICVMGEDGFVTLSFSDDGPGFSDGQLSEPPTALSTTKQDGHGLGLYSVNELVAASGGALRRRNATQGGAIVDVVLPPAES